MICNLTLILALMLAHAWPAIAEELQTVEVAPVTDELERWVPALSVSMGMMMQRGHLDFETSDIIGPAFDAPDFDDPFAPAEIRPAASGKDLMFAPIAHLSLELMTPGLSYVPFVPDVAIPGRPRIFAHGDVAASFAQKYDLAREGKIEDFVFPSLFDANENQILGQGSRGQVKLGTLVWSAGAGIAFTIDVFERRIRIKPSFEWMREKIKVSGDVRRLVRDEPSGTVGSPPRPAFGTLDSFRQIIFQESETKTFHGIGPGLEIEVESRRAGPILVSTFIGGRIYRVMGDLDIDFQASNEFDETADFHYTNNRWVYLGFVGIRLRLAPE